MKLLECKTLKITTNGDTTDTFIEIDGKAAGKVQELHLFANSEIPVITVFIKKLDKKNNPEDYRLVFGTLM